MVYTDIICNELKELKSKKKNSILLMGGDGTGKSSLIKEYRHNNERCIVIDNIDYMYIDDLSLFKIYYYNFIAKKILQNLIAINNFNIFITLYDKTRKLEKIMVYSKDNAIYNMYLANPELILDDIFSVIRDYYPNLKLTLIFDNFDVIGNSSELFQKIVYNYFKDKKNIKVIYTVSSKEVIESNSRINNLSIKNDILLIERCYDGNSVLEILDYMFINNISKNNRLIPLNNRPLVRINANLLHDMIKLSYGNLNLMYEAYMYSLDYEDIDSVIIDYIKNKNIKLDSVSRTRKLHI